MTIGEFSGRSGVSSKRLRTYAASGLLPPAGVDPENGYRYYSPAQLGDARLIDALRQAGMALARIADLLKSRSVDDLDAWAAELRLESDRKLAAVTSAKDLLAGVYPRPDSLVRAEGDSAMFLRSVARSEKGSRRDMNEDALVTTDRLVAVADGVGGFPAGEIASHLATNLIGASFTGTSGDELEALVRAANWAIWERQSADAAMQGMATTFCAVAIVEGQGLAVTNVGDCRAYLLHEGELVRLTEDHTVTAEMVRRGELPAEEAAGHPHRKVLTRVLGAQPSLRLDRGVVEVVAGDRVLVTSDGLVGEMTAQELNQLMVPAKSLEETLQSLFENALSNDVGLGDDVTAVLAEIS